MYERRAQALMGTYVLFYIARYEKEIASEGNIENAVSALEYFRDEMIRLYKTGGDCPLKNR